MSTNARLEELLSTMRNQQFMSDASYGTVTQSYDKIYFNNRHCDPSPDVQGYVTNIDTVGFSEIKGYFYLIKWKNLPYSQASWELHEDLTMLFGEEALRALVKGFNRRSAPIKRMLSTAYLRFNERPVFKEFTQTHPDFLFDVNSEFELKPH